MEAALAYDRAALSMRGSKARTNFFYPLPDHPLLPCSSSSPSSPASLHNLHAQHSSAPLRALVRTSPIAHPHSHCIAHSTANLIHVASTIPSASHNTFTAPPCPTPTPPPATQLDLSLVEKFAVETHEQKAHSAAAKDINHENQGHNSVGNNMKQPCDSANNTLLQGYLVQNPQQEKYPHEPLSSSPKAAMEVKNIDTSMMGELGKVINAGMLCIRSDDRGASANNIREEKNAQGGHIRNASEDEEANMIMSSPPISEACSPLYGEQAFALENSRMTSEEASPRAVGGAQFPACLYPNGVYKYEEEELLFSTPSSEVCSPEMSTLVSSNPRADMPYSRQSTGFSNASSLYEISSGLWVDQSDLNSLNGSLQYDFSGITWPPNCCPLKASSCGLFHKPPSSSSCSIIPLMQPVNELQQVVDSARLIRQFL